MALWRGVPLRRVPGYVGGQLLGAFLAAATLWVAWGGYYRRFHEANGVVGGEPGSEITGTTLRTSLPNPALAGVVVGDAASVRDVADLVTFPQAVLPEVVVTAVLVGVIFASSTTGTPSARARPPHSQPSSSARSSPRSSPTRSAWPR